MKGNFVGVPTDCPTREKSGFSGDAQAYVDTAMYLMDSYSTYAKWIKENIAGQYKDGVLPQISPKINPPQKKMKMMGIMDLDGGIGWSDAAEIIPLKLYHRFGDSSLINENYEALKKWTASRIKRASKTRSANKKLLPKELSKYTIDKGWMWGEWLEPDQDNVNYMKNLIFKGDIEVGTAFHYLNLKNMHEMSTILNKEEDKKFYLEEAKGAYNTYHYLFVKDGKINETKRQCHFVRPIVHGLLNEQESKEAVGSLDSLIKQNNNHLNTGFLTTHDLCFTLSDYGYVSTVYDLLLQEEFPSWLYAVKKGVTTIPENWDCYSKDNNPHNSFNHYSYGAVAGWLIGGMLGIKVIDGKIIIKPCIDQRIKYANGECDSPLGLIKSSWEIKDNKVNYLFDIPANNQATIIIDNQEYKVNSGIVKYSI